MAQIRVDFLEPAAAEFQEAVDWHEKISHHIAMRFRARIHSAIQTAASRPTSAGFLIGTRVRKILLRPFDYGLLYFFTGDVVYVVALAHNKRRPRYWQHRLNKFGS